MSVLKKYTKHNFVHLTESGDHSIMAAFKFLASLNVKNIIIPDQGGWLTYRDYPKKVGLSIKELKTNYGIVDTEILKSVLDESDALLYANPAGYIAQQPMAKIYSTCEGNNIVIADITGSIGSELCDGIYADILIGSFGEGKPINLKYGGFISFKSEKHYKQAKSILEENNFDGSRLKQLCEKLGELDERYGYLGKITKKIKEDLKEFNIIHRDKKGINVAVRFKNEEEKNKITSYCDRNNFPYTECPWYIRVNEPAISIEVKRL